VPQTGNLSILEAEAGGSQVGVSLGYLGRSCFQKEEEEEEKTKPS
jgi:hypothetical protein